MNSSASAPAAVTRSGVNRYELLELIRLEEPRLRTLAGASILMTGATGWFGVWLLDVLMLADDVLDLALEIVAISREPGRFLERFRGFADDPRLAWIKADVRDLEPAGKFSHVIHAATDNDASSDAASQALLFETMVEGTRRTLAAAGPQCRSFLYLSSGAIYGPWSSGQGFQEDATRGSDPSLPRSAYAEGKRTGEQFCAVAAALGTPVRIARCFAFVGPHMPFHSHFAIGNFIADAVSGRPIAVKSDGLPQRSYLYMTDLVRGLLAIWVDGAVGRPYNVGSEEGVTIGDLAHRVDRLVGGNGVIVGGASSDPSDRYVPDMTRLRTELRSSPLISLDAAIGRTAAWYRANHGIPMPS